ncbi:MAG: bis-aminopropyl spermidine synthase family protein [bacterium]|nr:bis-aminopropyl spermidine synthase family protein [bacterium]
MAVAARLAEGPEGVRRILRTVYLEGVIPIRNLAQSVGLPVPVLAAVRGELEKRRILTRKGGVALTEDGLATVKNLLGFSCKERFMRSDYPATPASLDGVRERLAELGDRRPGVDVKLDQSHATAETILKRAVYMYQNDALEGRDVLILGDDDMTSLALGLLAREMSMKIRKIVVLEFDQRLVSYLTEVSNKEGLPVKVIAHDLRQEIPSDLVGQFDVFLTDPPYTLAGLQLFVSRGMTALLPQIGKQAYVCFGRRTPVETASATGSMVNMGLAPVEIFPNFNAYEGAQVLGGVSQMIRLVATGQPAPLVIGTYLGDLYTADHKRKRILHDG